MDTNHFFPGHLKHHDIAELPIAHESFTRV